MISLSYAVPCLVGWLVIEVEQLFNVLKQWTTAVPARALSRTNHINAAHLSSSSSWAFKCSLQVVNLLYREAGPLSLIIRLSVLLRVCHSHMTPSRNTKTPDPPAITHWNRVIHYEVTIGAKPLPQTTLYHRQLDPDQQTSVKFELKHDGFYSSIGKMSSAKRQPFFSVVVPRPTEWTISRDSSVTDHSSQATSQSQWER